MTTRGMLYGRILGGIPIMLVLYFWWFRTLIIREIFLYQNYTWTTDLKYTTFVNSGQESFSTTVDTQYKEIYLR